MAVVNMLNDLSEQRCLQLSRTIMDCVFKMTAGHIIELSTHSVQVNVMSSHDLW